jgi:cardiolipin synthase
MRLGHNNRAALGGHRVLAPTEASLVAVAALAALALSLVALLFPRVVAVPAGVLGVWVAFALAMKAIRVRAASRARRAAAARRAPRPASPAPGDAERPPPAAPRAAVSAGPAPRRE